MPSGTEAGKWLKCNGQIIDPILYPELAALMTNTPDYQGLFLRGLGTQTYSQQNGTTIGITSTIHSSNTLGVIQGDSIRDIYGSSGAASDDYTTPSTGAFIRDHVGYEAANGGWSVWGISFFASRVVPTANENRPINKAVNYLIRAK